MKSKNFCLLFLLLILSFSANSQTTLKGKVTDVIDGKTLIITTTTNNKVTFQLQFIEVPETNQPLTSVVKAHLQQLALEKPVEYYATGLTDSTVVLGKVFINGTDLSQQMLRDGAAWYNLPQDTLYAQSDRDLYKNTESLAKNEKRGVWGVEGLKPSWEVRAELEKQLAAQKLAEATRLAEEARKKDEAEAARKSLRQSEEDSRRANNNVSMWADTSGEISFTGYKTSYDSGKNTTSLSSLSIPLQSTDLTSGDAMSLKVNHSFSGQDVKKATNDYYYFEVSLRSDKIDFSEVKGKKLMFLVGKDKYTLEFLNYKSAKVPDPKDSSGVATYKQQTLTFKMSKADFQKLIQATEIDFDMDVIKGTIAGVDLEVIKKVP